MGLFWSFLSALLWSTTFVSARYLLAGDAVDPITLSLLRFAIGSGVLVLAGIVVQRARFFAIAPADFLRLALLGLFGIVGMSVLLFFGQQTTSAGNGAMLMQLSPLFILLLGMFIGERVTLGNAAGCLLALLGTMLVVDVITPRGIAIDAGHLTGDLLVVAAAACWAIYSVAGKPVVERIGGYRATAWAMFFGALELVILRVCVPMTTIWPMGGRSWSIVLYLAIFPTAVAFFAWYEAMNKIPLSLLNVMQYLTPIFTLLIAWPLLGETVNWEKWIGVAIVLLGIALVSRRAPQRNLLIERGE